MTVGMVVACNDGIVIGADRKVTRSRGTRIKALEDKIHQSQFGDGRHILFCSSGLLDFARRALDEIEPQTLAEATDCSSYRDIVESKVCRIVTRLAVKGLDYDAVILFATTDTDGTPTIGHITPSGVTEMRTQGYFTTGIAAPYAELVLQDSYSQDISIDDAKLIVGGLIWRIGMVDNDVEGMDVLTIPKNTKKATTLTWAERQAIEVETLSFNFRDELDELKAEIDYWQKFRKKMDRKHAKEKKTPEENRPKQAVSQQTRKGKRDKTTEAGSQ